MKFMLNGALTIGTLDGNAVNLALKMMSLHVTRLMNLVVSHSVDPGRAAVRWILGRERNVKRMTNNLHCFIFR